MSNFVLHERLAADTFRVTDWPLCRVLLLNDARFPWCVLVPRRFGVRELHELDDADQCALVRESSRLSRAMLALFQGEKMNVAALGNIVSQLHVHHIVRLQKDCAWPKAVWGSGDAVAYAESARAALIERLRQAL